MKESNLRSKTKDFAISVIEACDTVDGRKGRDVLVRQLIRSATSIGANVSEANYAASKADFVNKLQIALKECFETEYWIEILGAVKGLADETAESCLYECGAIRRMLVKSINTAKGKLIEIEP